MADPPPRDSVKRVILAGVSGTNVRFADALAVLKAAVPPGPALRYAKTSLSGRSVASFASISSSAISKVATRCAEERQSAKR
jgi:hypothetical protein